MAANSLGTLVCLGNMCVDTLHKGEDDDDDDDEDDDDDDDNNNNNNNIQLKKNKKIEELRRKPMNGQFYRKLESHQ